ncbi:hypothetical protein BCR42DRAFT_410429 [Absidia repens]|uniref:Uncharacterized protein n=1 Tax=Absidia repens TaxID=90262 RepID=A0A1X2IP01_9FUNG|nr:hypothetical protein BCR42DRAFT_410429 [Absidia repens]
MSNYTTWNEISEITSQLEWICPSSHLHKFFFFFFAQWMFIFHTPTHMWWHASLLLTNQNGV